MNPYEAALRSLKRDLTRLNVRWALVGGFAVAAYGGARATQDVDAAVAVFDDRDAERLVHQIGLMGYQVVTHIERTDSSRLAGVRLHPNSAPPGLRVDLLFAASGIEQEVVAAAREVDVLPRLKMPVGSRGHLMAMKTLAHSDLRATDVQDVAYLLGDATPSDLEECRGALRLIGERGFGRGRDLQAEFSQFVARFHAEGGEG